MRHAKANPARRDWCQWRRCRQASDLIYHGAGVCGRHFETLCKIQDDHPRAEARARIAAALGLRPADLENGGHLA